LAGGYRGEAKDLSVRLQRGGQSSEFRLTDLTDGPNRDLRVYPGDRVSLSRAPRTFSVFGGSNRIEQLSFNAPSLSLAEAVAQVGGANPTLGDPHAVFVFRYVSGPDGLSRPIVYHVNMMSAGAYFLSQRFAMEDKDVLYIGNAAANQPSKLIQLISQLFSPLVVLTSAAQTLKN
jgi:polysaccharide export outer membrane protein